MLKEEAIPQLHPEAMSHLDELPTYMHAMARLSLSGITHEGLLQGNVPIPVHEHTDEHVEYADKARHQIERASYYVGCAYSEISEEVNLDHSNGYSQIAERALGIVLNEAIDAKQRGETEVAVGSLETFLVLTALEQARGNFGAALESIVAKGLGRELITATHQTFGMVAMVNLVPTPLNKIAQSRPELLRASSTLEFNDDFSDIAETGRYGSTETLNLRDITILEHSLRGREDESGRRTELLSDALHRSETESLSSSMDETFGRIGPKELAEIIIAANDANLHTDLARTLPILRHRRLAGNVSYRFNNPNTLLLDEAMMIIASSGRLNLAGEMMSSSDSEMQHIRRAAEYTGRSHEEIELLTSDLQAIHHAKQQATVAALAKNGLDDLGIKRLLSSAQDPDSAVGVPADFWATHRVDALLAHHSSDLLATATVLTQIEKNGLQESASLLVRAALRLSSEPVRQNVFLESFKQAVDSLQSADNLSQFDKKNIQDKLIGFADPLAALQASREIFGANDINQSVYTLQELLGARTLTAGPLEFGQKEITMLAELNNYLQHLDGNVSIFNEVTHLLLKDDDPVERFVGIRQAWDIMQTAPTCRNWQILAEVAKHKTPFEAARALTLIDDRVKTLENKLLDDIQKNILAAGTPVGSAEALIKALTELDTRQIDPNEFGSNNLIDLYDLMRTSADMSKDVDRLCAGYKIRKECMEQYSDRWQSVVETGDVESVRGKEAVSLEQFPELRSRLETLGIGSDLSGDLFAAWTSYSGLGASYSAKKDKAEDNGEISPVIQLSADEVIEAVNDQARSIYEQLQSLEVYVSRYGIDETIEVVQTFGIHNFGRYYGDILHEQLEQWKAGTVVPVSIIATARDDWNGAFRHIQGEGIKLFGVGGLFCFEVNGRSDLARVAVRIGDRERRMGRNPEQLNSVQSFVIAGHANPEGIRLGTNGEVLITRDFADDWIRSRKLRTEISRPEPNTYRRHLGHEFRVILLACSAAGEVEGEKNIAQAISEGHKVRVEGSPSDTYGIIEITPIGEVIYKVKNPETRERVPAGAVTYGMRYQQPETS